MARTVNYKNTIYVNWLFASRFFFRWRLAWLALSIRPVVDLVLRLSQRAQSHMPCGVVGIIPMKALKPFAKDRPTICAQR